MLKVVIVDDEMLVRIGIKTIINWEEHGFTIAGEAGNGVAALELCHEVQPDIVLTDIKMPQMNGLEFYRELKKTQPLTKFIILSCYDDFQYTKEALKLGAEDYILKMTMAPKDLLSIMVQVKSKIEGETVAQNEIIKLKDEVKKSQQVLKDKFLKELVFNNTYTTEQADVKFSAFHLDISDRQLAVVVLNVDNIHSFSTFQKEKDLKLMNTAILNIANEILMHQTNATLFHNELNEFVFIFCFHNLVSSEKIKSCICETIGKIKSTVLKYLSLSVSAGVSLTHNGYDQLFIAYTQAALALERKFFTHPGTIIFYASENPPKDSIDFDSIIQQYPFKSAIEEKNLEQFQLLLVKLTESLFGYPVMKVKQTCFETIFTFGDAKNTEMQKIINKYDAYNQIYQFDFLESITELLCRIAEDIILNSTDQTEKNSIVAHAKHYVKQHYNEEVSLAKISAAVNLSKNYFCQLFKSETKENFITYLTSYRIEKAKQLLVETELKTYEIAQKVGIPNTRHFSKIFRKETGCLPSEYKHKMSRYIS